jgi:hypothetical protein
MNNQRNADYIREQIRIKEAQKEVEKGVETLYYKPHFGPEETYERAMIAEDKVKQMKESLRESLAKQIQENKAVSEASKKEEMQADKIVLAIQSDTQQVENYAIARKNETMK